MKNFILLLSCFFIFLNSCLKQRPLIKVGIDTNWPKLELYRQGKNINGFIDEFLLKLCQEEKVRIELVKVNSFQLFDGLKDALFDVALTELYPFDFNLAKYAFTGPVFLTGSVLITKKMRKLEDFQDKLIGVVIEEDTNFVMQKYPEAIYKEYSSAPQLLDKVQDEFLDGGVLENLEAVAYVENIYSNLKIQKPLTDFGIRFIALKEKREKLEIFSDFLRYKKEINALKAKWDIFYQ